MSLSPAGPLIHEHRMIERVVAVLRGQLQRAEHGLSPDPLVLEQAVDFMRTFADRCHHGKEEHILFRRLADKPMDAALESLMSELVAEHVKGRELVGRLSETAARLRLGDAQASEEAAAALRGVLDLYPRHIEKEERRFFKPAIAFLDDGEREETMREYEEFEKELLHEKYGELVEDMERATRPPAVEPAPL